MLRFYFLYQYKGLVTENTTHMVTKTLEMYPLTKARSRNNQGVNGRTPLPNRWDRSGNRLEPDAGQLDGAPHTSL